MASKSRKRRLPAKVRLPLWALGLTGILLLGLLIASSIWLYRTVEAFTSTWEITDPDFGIVTEPDAPNAEAPVLSDPIISVAEEAEPLISTDALKPWEGEDRVSILLLGIDQRCNEEGPTHTDSMMLLTIDPVSLSAAILSLPRDLWVEIPDFGQDRINQAYYLGQIYEYPGGGPTLAVETVEITLGVKIDYFAAVNFDAFIEVVDLIGGIMIDVPERIEDPDYPDQCYGFDPFFIDAGTQLLDGETALKYARTRATFGGDVDRAGRQQAVVLAVRDQILQLDQLPDLISQSPQLWQALQDNVRTNMSLNEALQLALLMQDIPRDNIRTAVIDYSYVYNETTEDGRQVLVPLRENIRALRDELFAPPPVPTPIVENLPALMAAEEARIALFNGTPVFGLAASTQSYLQQFNINVVEIGNADAATYRTTQIIDYGTHPNTTRYLMELMGVPPLNISNGINPDGNYDILVIIGNDWNITDP